MSRGPLSVTFTGLDERLQELDKLEREQLPFATALALTRTAQEVQKGLVAEMTNVFDRPTRATLNGLFIQPATKQKLEARVWIKDGRQRTGRGGLVGREGVWDKGRSASRWLARQIYGGARGETGLEVYLESQGVLGGGKFVVPGENLPLDNFGNIGRGRLEKMLSGAQLINRTGFDANRTESKRSRAKGNQRYFVIKKGRKPIGIAERLGKGRNNIRIVLAFVRQPTYSQRFDFYGVAQRIAEDQLPKQFERALAQAVATRRR